jgi:hypothetical protein
VISLEDLAKSISSKSIQNGFTATWSWSGDDLNVQFTAHSGRPGPLLTLSRDRRRQTIGLLEGKRFGPWPEDAETFAWGRFWRAVRLAGGAAAPKPHAAVDYRGR